MYGEDRSPNNIRARQPSGWPVEAQFIASLLTGFRNKNRRMRNLGKDKMSIMCVTGRISTLELAPVATSV
jgi:hypothetical protein